MKTVLLSSAIVISMGVFGLSAYAEELININTADKTALMTLRGIGEVKAQAIINYRAHQGPFRKIEDVVNVKGIGPSTFADIKDFITVGVALSLPAPDSSQTSAPTAPPALEATAPSAPPPAAPMLAYSTESEAYPFWSYALALAAVIIIGTSGVLYARAAKSEIVKETKSMAEEFEITE